MAKRHLLKFQTITSGSMAGDLTSLVTNISNLDNIGIQLNYTGTPTGNFAVQVSADYQQDAAGNVLNAGNWISITLSPSPAATGAAGNTYIDMTELSAPWIRVKYTRTSGTGTLDAFITGKAQS